jgi:hypothetical protein
MRFAGLLILIVLSTLAELTPANPAAANGGGTIAWR